MYWREAFFSFDKLGMLDTRRIIPIDQAGVDLDQSHFCLKRGLICGESLFGARVRPKRILFQSVSSFRAEFLVNTRNELVRNIPSHNLPLLPITFLTIGIQTRNRPGTEVTCEPNRLNSTPSPAGADQGVTSPPKSIAGVVDVPDNPEQTTRVWLSFVLRLGFESRTLDFAVPFDGKANGVQRNSE